MNVKEVIEIDAKYQIQINDHGATVDLLRYNEPWFQNHPQGKVFIVTAYKIEKLDLENKKLKEKLNVAVKHISEIEEIRAFEHERNIHVSTRLRNKIQKALKEIGELK